MGMREKVNIAIPYTQGPKTMLALLAALAGSDELLQAVSAFVKKKNFWHTFSQAENSLFPIKVMATMRDASNSWLK